MSTKSLWTQLRHALGVYPDTAAEWAVRVQCADVTRQELLVLDTWLKADPRNAEAYARVNKISHLGLKLREHPEELARLQAYRNLRGSPEQTANPTWRRRTLQWTIAAAACVTVAVLVAVYWPVMSPGNRYVVGHGEQRRVTLADGSRMVINTDSEVRVIYDPATRVIALPRGEAFFEVAKNPARPFIVRAGTTEVRAVGTKFSVRRERAGVGVVVTEGRVLVSREDGKLAQAQDLTPGQQLMIEPKTLAAQVVRVDAERATSWTTGTVEFEDAPLDQVVREVNRYTAKTFVITDPALAALRLTGRFRVGDMESVKFALHSRFGITASEDENLVQLATAEPIPR